MVRNGVSAAVVAFAIDHDSAVTSAVAMFFFFSILLGLLPGFIGGTMSKNAGIAWPVGFAIGLFGSWLGVIGLYLLGQSRQATPQAGSGSEPSVDERLRTMKGLLDQGLITQEEYDEMRAKAIQGL